LSTGSILAIILIPVTLIVACCVILSVTGVLVTPLTSRLGPVKTTTPSTRATAAAGAKSQPIFAPVLGGTVADFDKLYGPPSDPGDTTGGIWQQAVIAGQQAMLLVSVDQGQDSRDGQLHVMQLSVQSPLGTTWDSSTQQRLVAVFLPADAKFKAQQLTSDGIERIYSSTQLAATFNPNMFTNAARTETVAPGTLFLMCFHGTAPVPSGGVADTCTLNIGVY